MFDIDKYSNKHIFCLQNQTGSIETKKNIYPSILDNEGKYLREISR